MTVHRFVGVLLAWTLLAASAGAATLSVPGDFPTVQAAIDSAPDGAVVQIAPGRYPEQLLLDHVSRGLTLRGDPADPASVVIDGGGRPGSTVKAVGVGGNVTIEGLTITGGTGGENIGGGLFLANSDMVFRNVVFSGNSTTTDGGGAFILTSGGFFKDCIFTGNSSVRFGGGVLLNVQSTTYFEDCQFFENDSGTADDVEGWGGGVHINDSSPTFVRCVIRNNRSKFAGGGVSATGHYNYDEAQVTFRDCEVAYNEAVRGNPSIDFTDGGGMHFEDNVRAVITRSHIHHNTASNGGGLSAYRSTYDIANTLIESNHAVVVVPNVSGGYGGGITMTSVNGAPPARKASTLTLRHSVVRNNDGHVGGGILVQGDFGTSTTNRATLLLEDSLVGGNTASGRAGGLYLDRTDATIRRAQVLNNQVTAVHDAWGGGIGTVSGSATTVEDSAICGNSVAELGGGIYADQGGTLQVSGSYLFGNVAGTTGGVGGSAIAVAAASGPTPGPVTGAITGSVLAGSAAPDIWESDCNLPMWSAITYSNNQMHAGGNGVYFRNCIGFAATVAAFNAVPGKASGNVEATPHFVHLLAAPSVVVAGGTSVLSWCSAGTTNPTITGGVGAVGSDIGWTDVQPATTTTYEFTDNGVTAASAMVTSGCPTLGVPLPAGPGNGSEGRSPAGIELAWHAATGATLYDVYLGTDPHPTTPVAEGHPETTLTLPPLTGGATYYWKVVARGGACADPVESPVSSFTTCAGSYCFSDDFDDDDVSDWTVIGKGVVQALGDGMVLRAKRRLGVVSPVPSFSTGVIRTQLEIRAGLRDVRILFGVESPARYRQLVIKRSGKMRLEERTDGIARRVGLGRRLFGGKPLPVTLTINGGEVSVDVDGAPVLSGDFGSVLAGSIGFETVRTGATIDDFQVEGEP